MQNVIDLLREGAEMKAVGAYRQATNLPLYEAIVGVVEIARTYNIPIPQIDQTKPAKDLAFLKAA